MYPRNFRGGKKGGNTPDCLKVCPFIPRTDNYFVGMKNDFPLRLLLRHMWHIRVQQTNKQTSSRYNWQYERCSYEYSDRI